MKSNKVCSAGYWRGVFTRFIFMLHGLLAIYILYINKNLNNIHLLLIVPLMLLFLESVTTLCIRRGKELRHIWLCGLFYISTIVPIIWFIDLKVLEERRANQYNTTMVFEIAKLLGSNDTASIQRFLLPDELKVSDVTERRICQVCRPRVSRLFWWNPMWCTRILFYKKLREGVKFSSF